MTQSYYTSPSNSSGAVKIYSDAGWPRPLSDAAYHGVVGEFVTTISPHTESDPAAILIQFQVAFGNLIGRSAHFQVDAVRHFLNLFAVLVGGTSKSRKGTSWARVVRTFSEFAYEWSKMNQRSGLSSGEGLIWAIRDAIQTTQPKRTPRGRRVSGYETVQTDPGVPDKRPLVVESEFASTLKVCARDGNTLSAVMRQAWDGETLRILSKNSPAQATDPHVSVIGHITRSELRRYITATEEANGFANRILWACVRRSKLLPDGGHIETADISDIVVRLFAAADFAGRVGPMSRDEQARDLWHDVYSRLSEDRPGLYGAVTARAEAQTMRLACIYALLDLSSSVRPEHLLAALEVWRFCEDSARYVFGDALGDPVADGILFALRTSATGLTKTAISDLFGRNRRASEIGRALGVLGDAGLIWGRDEETGGRNVQRWFATSGGTETLRPV